MANAAKIPETVTVSKWREFDNYECSLCPHATIDLPDAVKHSRQHSKKAAAPSPAPAKMRDRFGNEDAPAGKEA